MRYQTLALDYDGTIATKGRVEPATIAALERWRTSGGRLILVTGRELSELREACPRLDLFDRIVAENGAVVLRPDGSTQLLGQRPPDAFIDALRQRGVAPISVGQVVVATWRPFETVAETLIREMGLPLRVILNKRAVMILPEGVEKQSGLKTAARELGIALEGVVGIGDAENDLAFLQACGCSVAVANALPEVKSNVDVVSRGASGEGVVERIDLLLKEEARSSL